MVGEGVGVDGDQLVCCEVVWVEGIIFGFVGLSFVVVVGYDVGFWIKLCYFWIGFLLLFV